MKITAESVTDVELAINNLKQQKEKLTFDKKEIELKISDLNNKVRSGGRMPDSKYNQICEQQSKFKGDIIKLERAISELSVEIRNKSVLKDQLKIELTKQEDSDVKQKLKNIRDHYINFAADKSRVASMRAMSAEFAEKLEAIIKVI